MVEPHPTDPTSTLEVVLEQLLLASTAATRAAAGTSDFARIDLATGITLLAASVSELLPGTELRWDTPAPEPTAAEGTAVEALQSAETNLRDLPVTTAGFSELVVDVCDLLREAQALVQP